MLVEVTTAEHQVLMELVERRMEDLGPEIRRCRSYHYREELKEERRDLETLLNRLRTSGADVVPATG